MAATPPPVTISTLSLPYAHFCLVSSTKLLALAYADCHYKKMHDCVMMMPSHDFNEGIIRRRHHDEGGSSLSASRKESSAIVVAPPGKLGLILANRTDARGTVVSGVRAASALAEQVFPGDCIVAIDDEDVSQMNVEEITAVMACKSEHERILVLGDSTADGSRNRGPMEIKSSTSRDEDHTLEITDTTSTLQMQYMSYSPEAQRQLDLNALIASSHETPSSLIPGYEHEWGEQNGTSTTAAVSEAAGPKKPLHPFSSELEFLSSHDDKVRAMRSSAVHIGSHTEAPRHRGGREHSKSLNEKNNYLHGKDPEKSYRERKYAKSNISAEPISAHKTNDIPSKESEKPPREVKHLAESKITKDSKSSHKVKEKMSTDSSVSKRADEDREKAKQKCDKSSPTKSNISQNSTALGEYKKKSADIADKAKESDGLMKTRRQLEGTENPSQCQSSSRFACQEVAFNDHSNDRGSSQSGSRVNVTAEIPLSQEDEGDQAKCRGEDGVGEGGAGNGPSAKELQIPNPKCSNAEQPSPTKRLDKQLLAEHRAKPKKDSRRKESPKEFQTESPKETKQHLTEPPTSKASGPSNKRDEENVSGEQGTGTNNNGAEHSTSDRKDESEKEKLISVLEISPVEFQKESIQESKQHLTEAPKSNASQPSNEHDEDNASGEQGTATDNNEVELSTSDMKNEREKEKTKCVEIQPERALQKKSNKSDQSKKAKKDVNLRRWTCNVCHEAAFDDHDDAMAHEEECVVVNYTARTSRSNRSPSIKGKEAKTSKIKGDGRHDRSRSPSHRKSQSQSHSSSVMTPLPPATSESPKRRDDDHPNGDGINGGRGLKKSSSSSTVSNISSSFELFSLHTTTPRSRHNGWSVPLGVHKVICSTPGLKLTTGTHRRSAGVKVSKAAIDPVSGNEHLVKKTLVIPPGSYVEVLETQVHGERVRGRIRWEVEEEEIGGDKDGKSSNKGLKRRATNLLRRSAVRNPPKLEENKSLEGWISLQWANTDEVGIEEGDSFSSDEKDSSWREGPLERVSDEDAGPWTEPVPLGVYHVKFTGGLPLRESQERGSVLLGTLERGQCIEVFQTEIVEDRVKARVMVPNANVPGEVTSGWISLLNARTGFSAASPAPLGVYVVVSEPGCIVTESCRLDSRVKGRLIPGSCMEVVATRLEGAAVRGLIEGGGYVTLFLPGTAKKRQMFAAPVPFGTYRIVQNAVPVTLGVSPASPVIATLKLNATAEIIETCVEDECVRGRICTVVNDDESHSGLSQDAGGWINLVGPNQMWAKMVLATNKKS
ncbi:hypothetical protein ACHAWF_008026 [Thalassiosira exigua]